MHRKDCASRIADLAVNGGSYNQIRALINENIITVTDTDSLRQLIEKLIPASLTCADEAARILFVTNNIASHLAENRRRLLGMKS